MACAAPNLIHRDHFNMTTRFAGEFQWFAAFISLFAFIALWKYKLDILKVLGACAGLGLAYTFLLN